MASFTRLAPEGRVWGAVLQKNIIYRMAAMHASMPMIIATHSHGYQNRCFCISFNLVSCCLDLVCAEKGIFMMAFFMLLKFNTTVMKFLNHWGILLFQ